tara:strand:- start:166 stop:339 length:174 start_codon:yes stop_codon:yes gene_type:complete
VQNTTQIKIEMHIIEPDVIEVIDIYGDHKVIPVTEVEDFNDEQRQLTELSLNSVYAS